jgi:hypothetical protein
MTLSLLRTRFVRVLVALGLAAVTGGLGGGVALACESISAVANKDQHAMAEMPGMTDHAPAHNAGNGDGCDSSDRTRECPLMLACAPAMPTTTSDGTRSVVSRASAIEWRAGSPTSASRQPEPPPPRA